LVIVRKNKTHPIIGAGIPRCHPSSNRLWTHENRRLKIHKTPHPNQGREVIPALPPMLPNRPTYVRAIGRNPSQFIIGHSRMESFNSAD